MITNEHEFAALFRALTGNPPFPWQRELYRRFTAGEFPKSCNLPTGLGKTSVIPIWMLALAASPTVVPRRLVYVVNRRTVVDQATDEAVRIRKALGAKAELRSVADALQSLAAFSSDIPLAISTLRGQFADNAEWRNDPTRPAVIVGTVDMIGSRLLFAGYGCGFKSRPLHAGFLGQDTLLVHDEAHLEPAFQELIVAIEAEQQRCCEFGRFRVMALTATSRTDGEQSGLTDADRKHAVVRKRIEAKKGITFCAADDQNHVADEVAERALKHKGGGQAILVFLRELKNLHNVAKKIDAECPGQVQSLTGTMRGLERDALAKEDAIFARFMPKPGPGVTPQLGTVYLVCTSAGEVGIDISADHLVCDLTPFESMAQRFGRVNRFGTGDARIDVVYESKSDEKKKDDPYEHARWATLRLLRTLPTNRARRRDASPAALGNVPVSDRQAAFTPPPVILPVSDILFDAWALTSVRERLPGRPPVADWLHGLAEWEPPETHVGWREEVDVLSTERLGKCKPEDLLDDYPLKPHELLQDNSSRVFKELERMVDRHSDREMGAWLIEPDGEVTVLPLRRLVERGRQNLDHRTVLLAPKAGGLKGGMLDGAEKFDEACSYDVADSWTDQAGTARRCRVWDDEEPPEGMRLVRAVDIRPFADDEPEGDEEAPGRRYWYWYVQPRSADDDGSRTARQKQGLSPHLQSAERFASALVAKLKLSEPEASAITLAARWHDLGKHRAIWQRSIANRDYPQQVLAKSGRGGRLLDLNDYRHEFGSLIDLEKRQHADFGQLAWDVRDLVLHLIAAHHGRARPHFPLDEAFDPEREESDAAEVARKVPRRFARLQRQYGRWGLAYIESLVRAADVLASQARDASISGPVESVATPTKDGAR
ncbi:MAG: type I-U CRISPR-associated helicase/endonuclease Cas3 [Deltaproteobacteria bacterium]|nr:type I-U CRISPR-associated helicase/endonuclease Cas3 [Deltaproteobacteria bacterium]